MDDSVPGTAHLGATLAVFFGAALICGVIANALTLGSYHGDLDDADFIIGPVDLPVAVVVLLVVVGVAVLARAVGSQRETMRRAPLLRWAFAFAVVAGLLGGACFALVAAPATGANIGGGMAILFGAPLVIVLVGGAVVLAARALPGDAQGR